jgi:glycine betaine/proline transport system permease protein
MLVLPWAGVLAFVMALAFRLGGLRLAALCGALTLFIAIAGQWEKAMLSVYLVGIAVAIAASIGIPLGFVAAKNEKMHNVAEVVLDTLQTLPSFVYLIPVVMLLGVGDFSALVAIVLYAVAPAVRYTSSAVRQVPASVIEAAEAFGATRRQIRRRIILPLALPDIVLGLNQTLMLGISMLVITALVGTRDLGQETLIALSKADPGRGLVAGICVAFIAIIADRIMRAWIDRRRKGLGLHAN